VGKQGTPVSSSNLKHVCDVDAFTKMSLKFRFLFWARQIELHSTTTITTILLLLLLLLPTVVVLSVYDRVADNCAVNHMPASNLALVFGPTLMKLNRLHTSLLQFVSVYL